MPRLAPVLAAVCLGAAGCSADALDPGAPSGGADRGGRVERIVDGDTLVVGGEKVRLIGVDTPETRKPGTPVECFGRAATAYVTRLALGRRVRLVLDAEERDRYGRLLAYVFLRGDGRFVNAALVRDGYALALTVPPNVRHAGTFRALQREARRERRGLWDACPD